jgi:hypothetical protein
MCGVTARASWRQLRGISTMTAFFRSDIATSISGLFGCWLAMFGSDPLSIVIAVLLIVNLQFAIAINLRKLRRR